MARLSFTEHPRSVGESYLQHLQSAWRFSAGMIYGGLACFLHGLLPFLCTTTGSSTIRGLHDRMAVNRMRAPSANDHKQISPQSLS